MERTFSPVISAKVREDFDRPIREYLLLFAPIIKDRKDVVLRLLLEPENRVSPTEPSRL